MLTIEKLETIEIEPSQAASSSVIWMHGLGADGNDFVPIVSELGLPETSMPRFIFPHAPVRPVTLNAGMAMPAWFDVIALDENAEQDREGIARAETCIQQLIQQEIDRGIASNNIYLAGFSQGGALALYTGLRYPEPLAGLIGLSCFLPLDNDFVSNTQTSNQTTPIFLAHGSDDPLVPMAWGEKTRDLLQARDYAVQWHSYPMEHSVCAEEVRDLGQWLAFSKSA